MVSDQEAVAGVEVYRGAVEPAWIDVNQHMNVAYYVLAFDLAVDSLWTRFGIDEEYVRSGHGSTFAVECHVTWQRELLANANFIITSQVLAYDHKRIHQFMRMYHAEQHYLAATAEWMNLHVDLESRRVAPWHETVFDKIAGFAHAQESRPMPTEAGQQMRVTRPDYQADGYPTE